MTDQLAHPSPQALSAFTRGQLADGEASAVEAHVSTCDTCCDTLLSLQDEDTFVGQLRDAEHHDAERGDGDATIELALGAVRGPQHESGGLAAPDRYRVQQLIGLGGMGDVYLAEHRMMRRPVALKVINRRLTSRPEAVARFQREVHAAARLSHPNIVTAYDADQADGVHFLAMEYVEGDELSKVVRIRGPLPVDVACDYARQAAEGLQHAHEAGMVHRDIKPNNLMLTPAGRIKILDFGLASLAQEARHELADGAHHAQAPANGQLTMSGSLLGTPDYLPPEQIEDAQSVTTRSDIYSLGCTLYFMLAGKPPFADLEGEKKLAAHQYENAAVTRRTTRRSASRSRLGGRTHDGEGPGGPLRKPRGGRRGAVAVHR